ncbi:hypothetical protein [Rhodopirellula bahusiensis]|uniref:Uncharacterized protein n=1 Tax=Rhodopirellula bahusiensis TaxID=2014065 RepID=A0A2G1W405_9BACT|nr:hypothetical protein [Rhodopirellula bahusiensis]PHQ33778.1 hypothetical protein CEE69_17745 [Rhodopirellula bahusiensis]
MADVAPVPSFKRAIGSGYLIQQSPGGEMIGGVEVTLRHAKTTAGSLVALDTVWQSQSVNDVPPTYQQEAVAGIRKFANKRNIDLTRFHIEIGRFVVHDVDSMPVLYYLAAQNAFESALNMWNRMSNVSQNAFKQRTMT